MSEELTQEQLKQLIVYEPDSGFFYWKKTRGPCLRGSLAGTKTKAGYTQICIKGKAYLAHRLVWLYIHGCFPLHGLDHVNRVKSDNRLDNLRIALPYENHQNLPRFRTNKSGAVGVCWDKNAKKWRAYIKLHGKLINLGSFDSFDEAKMARASGKIKYHKFNPKDAGLAI